MAVSLILLFGLGLMSKFCNPAFDRLNQTDGVIHQNWDLPIFREASADYRVKYLEETFWVGRLHGARKVRPMFFRKKPSLYCGCLLIHGVSVCLLLRRTRALRCNVPSYTPDSWILSFNTSFQTEINRLQKTNTAFLWKKYSTHLIHFLNPV